MDRSNFFKDDSTSPQRRPAEVIRISGSGSELLPQLTLADLPPPGTTRWVMRRKAEVVAGVRNGLLTLEEACTRYTLSVEEFLSWQELIDRHGVRALRATCVKNYRNKDGRVQQTEKSTHAQRSPYR